MKCKRKKTEHNYIGCILIIRIYLRIKYIPIKKSIYNMEIPRIVFFVCCFR